MNNDYILKRESFIDDPISKPYVNSLKAKFDNAGQLDQLKTMGVKSAKTAKVVTEAQDKANRAKRFEEDNIVNAWAKWFKKTYPGTPYTIDKVANKRNIFSGAIMSASSYQRGNPDIFVQCKRAGFAGLYIEQKKSEDIFYNGTRILRPGSDNEFVWQSLYHADLREQGYWVMFSISLESSQKITQRYMAGNPYKMQEFKYYCKPEFYDLFSFHKHFNPVGEGDTTNTPSENFLSARGL